MNGCSEPLARQACFLSTKSCAEITVKERNQFSVFCEKGRCDAGFLVWPLKQPGDTGGIEGRMCFSACQSTVTAGTFSDGWDIYRCVQMKICNIICICVESVVRQQKSKISLCFPSSWSSTSDLSCETYWPTFQ